MIKVLADRLNRDDKVLHTILSQQNAMDRVAEQIEQLRNDLPTLAERYTTVSDPAIDDPIVCPNDHKGCLVVATIVEVDSKTLAQKPCGYGIYCPKCQSSFYYQNGHRWSVAGTTVEVDNGIPSDTPKGVHREPETKRRPLKFRG